VSDLDVERTHNLVANGLITHNSVYSWRSADVRNILGFAERHPDHVEIVLGRNFRSRAEFFEAAVSCVSHAEHRVAKALIATRGTGGHLRVVGLGNEYQEVHWVAGRIADALAAGTPPAEILALARTGYVTEPLQHALAHHGIPHRVLGSLGLYERTEVRDPLAYLTLLQNPRDAQAFRRAVSSPRRGVGNATVTLLVAWAREHHGGDLIAASANAASLDRVSTQTARYRLVEFGSGLSQVRSELEAKRSLAHVVIATVTMPGGLVGQYQHVRDHSPNADRRTDAERVLEDLRSLCRAAQAYEEHHDDATLTGFLDHAVGLHAQEVDATTDHRITMSTIHRAKGAEAQLVVLLGCEEQLLPSWRSLPSPDPQRLEEERRLFYVAVTRAKDRLLITHVAERGRRPTGGPSRFLTEAGLLSQATREESAPSAEPESARRAGPQVCAGRCAAAVSIRVVRPGRCRGRV
jgi:DNA helicase II / ATP-dependent DNA helicase PcrA